MAQHDQVIDNGPGLAVRTDLNSALSALFSSSSGPVEPVVKTPGQLWCDTSTPAVTRVAVRDQTNAVWLNVAHDSGGGSFNTLAAGDSIEASGPNAFVAVSGGAVHRAGDTMTGGLRITKPFAVAGDQAITIAPSSGSPVLMLNKTTGANANAIQGFTAGVQRWGMNIGSSAAETGANVGSDFILARYTDAGVVIDNPLTIGRASAQVNMSGQLIANSYGCKPGSAGAATGNFFNLNYASPNVQMWIGTTNLGNITLTSDYRIKKDVAPLASMWERLKALKPISYTHQDYTPPGSSLKEDGSPPDPLVVNDDTERWGFVAHELQEALIMDAATGFKDSPEHIQSPNPWTLLATVTKALQEAMSRIEALEAAAAR
jgi:hypothetical protein